MTEILDRTEETVEGIRFLDVAEHPDVMALASYWEAKRGARPMPDRAGIVPAEIVRLLPNIIISEVLGDGEDFRTRIFGTALVALVGEERTGKLLSEFSEKAALPTRPDAVQERWFGVTRRAYRTGRPVFVTGAMESSDRPCLTFHGVSCPLTAGGTETRQMLGGLFVVDRR